MFLNQIFQTGYVTTDMDRAISVFAERYNAGKYMRIGKCNLALDDGGKMTVDIALGWVGDMMIELIQPIADNVSIYTDLLPQEGFGLQFHHFGVLLQSDEQWSEMESRARVQGHRTVLSLTVPNSRALYIDTRADLGHYLEYVHHKELQKTNFSRIPQNIVGHKIKFT